MCFFGTLAVIQKIAIDENIKIVLYKLFTVFAISSECSIERPWGWKNEKMETIVVSVEKVMMGIIYMCMNVDSYVYRYQLYAWKYFSHLLFKILFIIFIYWETK